MRRHEQIHGAAARCGGDRSLCPPPTPPRLASRLGGRMVGVSILTALVALGAWAWWAAANASMPMAFGGFFIGWVVMMVAMMFPGLIPVVRLYMRAAGRRTVAPVPVFLSGYLLVWSVAGMPVFLAWRHTAPAVAAGAGWVARVAGATLLLAAAYQLTPLKSACLRRCRTPVSAFMAVRGSLRHPVVALAMGARNGLWCLGCCWALMAVLVAIGVMQPWWMAAIAGLILAEKALPLWRWVPAVGAAAAATIGTELLFNPSALTSLT